MKCQRSSNLKGWCWGGVEVEHVSRGGWCRRIWTNGNTGLRLAKRWGVEELSGSLEAVGRRECLPHDVQTDAHSLWTKIDKYRIIPTMIQYSRIQQNWTTYSCISIISIKLHLQEELSGGVLGAE